MNLPNDRFEEFVRDAARGYHQPPASVPRDAMWGAIVNERRRRAAAMARQRIQLRWVVGIAAVLVLGVAIGRFTAPQFGGQTAEVTALGTANGNVAYHAAASEYLVRVETLLTLFRMQARTGGKPDESVTATARGLLSTSRLLQDSPAGAEPRMKELLEDLELVLARIAQLSAEKGSDPTSVILQTLEDHGVLFRLRAAVPAASLVSAQGAL